MQKKFAENLGYREQENTDNLELAYDFIAFRDAYAVAREGTGGAASHRSGGVLRRSFSGRSPRCPGPAVPPPPCMPRGIRLRTQHERIFRRLRIYDVAVGEIGFFDPDEYVNPHALD